MRRTWTTAFLALACLCSGNPGDSGVIRIAGDLTMKPPFELVQLSRWRDGGSLGFVFRDARAKELRFCRDGRIGSPTAGRWYLGTTHPTHQGAELVAAGSATESASVELLDRWVAQHYSPSERTTLLGEVAFDQLQKDRKRFDAWTICHLLERLKKDVG